MMRWYSIIYQLTLLGTVAVLIFALLGCAWRYQPPYAVPDKVG